MIPKTERLLKYTELHDVSYGIDNVARPLLLFFSSENQLLWFRHGYAVSSLMDTAYCYDRDLRELYTRSGAVRDEIFSQRYRFRSLEREQERAMVTFSAIWRPVLALEAWAGQTDA
ncbi:hypothetical protein Tco_1219732 [Tanacetum coccineum]